MDTGTLPGVGSGVTIDLGWRPRHFSLEANGFYLAARDTHLAAKPTEGAGVHGFGFGARACWQMIDDAPLDLSPCGGADMVFLDASGFGSDVPGEATAQLLRVDFALRFAYRFSYFGIFVEPGGAIPFTRPEFVIQNAGSADRVGFATFLGKIGAQAHF